jgi:hypothetical protein
VVEGAATHAASGSAISNAHTVFKSVPDEYLQAVSPDSS